MLSPGLVIGGVALSILLNLFPLLRVRRTTEEGTPTVTLVLRVGVLNLLLALFGAALFATVLGYAFVENFTMR